MRQILFFLGLLFASGVYADVSLNQPAPDFSVKDTSGKVRHVTDFKGKWVVLEWYNKDCPFVRKHYDSKNMQGLQKKYMAQGVAWIPVISSAKGKQGYMEGAEAEEQFKKHEGTHPTTVLLDPDGKMGQAYGAKTTPHMFVINPEGLVVYAGGIDDNNSPNPKVIPQSKNWVSLALDSGMKKEKIEKASAPPYGCSVKYN